MGDRITVATLPDAASAELVREVLHDGGIDQVEVRGVPGVAYLGRASALDYAVSVDDVDEARARQVLADFEADSAQAATSQAAVPPAASGDALDDAPLRKRKPYVLWGFIALASVTVIIPVAILLFEILRERLAR